VNEREAQESTRAVEQMWEIELGPERSRWIEALLPFDSVTVSSAILKLYESAVNKPTVEELIASTIAMGRVREEFEARREPRLTDANPILAPWVLGWAVARHRHGDFRVLPGQKEGYDRLQAHNPGYRTYVWPDQEQMPEEDVARYIEEGSALSAKQVVQMITSGIRSAG
jgi:hypothetical protein